MKCTLRSLVRLPEMQPSDSISSPFHCWYDPAIQMWRMERGLHDGDLPEWNIWQAFKDEPRSCGTIMHSSMSIEFQHAYIIEPLNKGRLQRTWNSYSTAGKFSFQVTPLARIAGISIELSVSFEPIWRREDVDHKWDTLWYEAVKFHKLLRLQNKIDQATGLRKDAKAYWRLMNEAKGLASSAMIDYGF